MRPGPWLPSGKWLTVALVLATVAEAQRSRPIPKTPQDGGVVGVVSLIDIGAQPGAAAEDEGRGPYAPPPGVIDPDFAAQRLRYSNPFVDVLHVPLWEKCKAANRGRRYFDDTGCDKYEWSTPFIPQSHSDKIEEELSKAWNEFDARVMWRLRTQVNVGPTAEAEQVYTEGFSFRKNCSKPQRDRYLRAWERDPNGQIDPGLFCGGSRPGSAQAPQRPGQRPGQGPGRPPGNQSPGGAQDEGIRTDRPPAYRLTLCENLSPDGQDPYTNLDELKERRRIALQDGIRVYYPDYWDRVYEAIKTYMPYSLQWDGVYQLSGAVGTEGGAIIQPTYAPLPQFAQYNRLATNAFNLDPRGYLYMLQQYPNDVFNFGFSEAQRKLRLRPLVPERPGPQWPGVQKLEMLKYGVPTREDIFESKWKWADVDGVWAGGARPLGERGTGMLREYEGVGHVTFLRLFSRIDVEDTPREAVMQRACYRDRQAQKDNRLTLYTKGVSTLDGGVGIRVDNPAFQVTRVHTDWHSVPEGYPILNVRKTPTLLRPGDEPKRRP